MWLEIFLEAERSCDATVLGTDAPAEGHGGREGNRLQRRSWLTLSPAMRVWPDGSCLGLSETVVDGKHLLCTMVRDKLGESEKKKRGGDTEMWYEYIAARACSVYLQVCIASVYRCMEDFCMYVLLLLHVLKHMDVCTLLRLIFINIEHVSTVARGGHRHTSIYWQYGSIPLAVSTGSRFRRTYWHTSIYWQARSHAHGV